MRIYAYELPKNLTDDIIEAPYLKSWLKQTGHEFEADSLVHKIIMSSPHRTDDPEEATLFYIPALVTRFLHVMEGRNGMSYMDSMIASGLYFREALDIVKRRSYWSRMNGRDHFTVVTDDRARCSHFEPSLDEAEWGEMFFLQHQGDLLARSREEWKKNFACYDPDKDVLVPISLRLRVDVTDTTPTPDERNITALFAFGDEGVGSSVPYFGINVRSDLLARHAADPIPGSLHHVTDIASTVAEMSRSVFCITPPRFVPHTSRFYRAIVRGCIPVTFFRAFHLPFEDQGLDYSSFVVNIQPHNLKQLKPTLERLLLDEQGIGAMQKRLAEVCSYFLWDGESQGAGRFVMQSLAKRSHEIARLRWSYSQQQGTGIGLHNIL